MPRIPSCPLPPSRRLPSSDRGRHQGKVDHLVGLKENVIIGKLIPAGSGLTQYRKFDTFDDEATYRPGNRIVADAWRLPRARKPRRSCSSRRALWNWSLCPRKRTRRLSCKRKTEPCLSGRRRMRRPVFMPPQILQDIRNTDPCNNGICGKNMIHRKENVKNVLETLQNN